MVTSLSTAILGAILTYKLKQIHSIYVLSITVIAIFLLYGSFMKPLFFISEKRHEIDTSDWKKNEAINYEGNYFEAEGSLPLSAKYKTDRKISKWNIIRGKGKVKEIASSYHNLVFDIKAEEPLLLRINTHYFPGWKITIDDNETLPYFDDKVGFMSVSIPQGIHRIQAKFTDTPIRLWSNIISAVSILVLLLISGYLLSVKIIYKENKLSNLIALKYRQYSNLIITVAVAIPVLAVFFSLSSILLKPGIISGGDYSTHLIRAKVFMEALSQGQFPVRWVEYSSPGLSFPLFNFYMPGFYYLMSILYQFAHLHVFTLKLLLLFIWWIGAFWIYLYTRRFSKIGAIGATLIYSFTPHILFDLFVMSAWPEFLAISLIPGLLWAYDRLLVTGKKNYVLPLGIFTALLLISHLPTVLIITPVFLAYFFFSHQRLKKKQSLMLVLLGVGLGLGLSAFFTLPFISEISYVKSSVVTTGETDFHKTFISLKDLVIPRWGYGLQEKGLPPPLNDPVSVQIGVIQLAIIIISFIFLVVKLLFNSGKPRSESKAGSLKAPLVFWLLTIFYVVFFTSKISLFIWETVPFMPLVQAGHRFLLLIPLASAALFVLLISKFQDVKKQAGIVLLLLPLTFMLTGSYLHPANYIPENIFNFDSPTWRESRGVQETSEPAPLPAMLGVDLPPKDLPIYQVLKGEGTVRLRKFDFHQMEFEIDAKSPLLFSINSHYFPGWKVFIDNNETKILRESRFGFLLVNVSKGTHVVKTAFTDTPVRQTANMISLSFLVILAAWSMYQISFVEYKFKQFLRFVLYRNKEASEENKLKRTGFIYTSISLILLSAALIYISFTLLAPGIPFGHDTISHLIRTKLFSEAFSQGQIPVRWTEWVWNGASLPLFNFYQVGYYYLVSLLYVIIPSITFSMKLAIIFSFWIGTIFMFLYLRRFSTITAALGSFLYIFTPYILSDVFIRAAFPEFLAINILPGLLWSIDRLLATGKSFYAFAFSLLLAIGIFSHLPVFVIFIPVLSGYALLLYITGETSRKSIILTAISTLAGIGIASFYWMPAVLELRSIRSDLLISSYYDFNSHFLTLPKLFESEVINGFSVPALEQTMPIKIGFIHWGIILLAISLLVYKLYLSVKSNRFSESLNPKSQALNSNKRQDYNLKNIKQFKNSDLKHLDLIRNLKFEIRNLNYITPHLLFWLLVSVFALYFSLNLSSGLWNNLAFINFILYPWRFLFLFAISCSALIGLMLHHVRQKHHQIIIMSTLVFIIFLLYREYIAPYGYIPDNIHKIDSTDWKTNNMYLSDDNFNEAAGNLPLNVMYVSGKEIPKWDIIQGKADIKELTTKFHESSFIAKSQEPFRFRLNTHYYPGWKVYINGKESKIDRIDSHGFININLGKGTHEILFAFTDTLLRKSANIFSILSFFFLSVWLLYPILTKKYSLVLLNNSVNKRLHNLLPIPKLRNAVSPFIYHFFRPFTLSLLLLIIIIYSFTQIIKPLVDTLIPGEKVKTIPATKIARGEKHPDYPTNPPSSGWYVESNMRTGIFTNPVSDEQLVEALTKGAVVINYNCNYKPPAPPSVTDNSHFLVQPLNNSSRESGQSKEEQQKIWNEIKYQNQQCGEIISAIREVVDKKDKKYIIMSPSLTLDARIALVSWGRIDKMILPNKDRIEKFIDAYIGEKPEL